MQSPDQGIHKSIDVPVQAKVHCKVGCYANSCPPRKSGAPELTADLVYLSVSKVSDCISFIFEVPNELGCCDSLGSL